MPTDNPPPLPVTVPPLKERHFGVHHRAPPPQPPPQAHPQMGVQGNANFHHAMLSPPVAGQQQSTFHPATQPHHLGKLPSTQSPESYYNVPVQQHHHTHGAMLAQDQMGGGGGAGMIPHAHFRHPADLSYSNAEMRQS